MKCFYCIPGKLVDWSQPSPENIKDKIVNIEDYHESKQVARKNHYLFCQPQHYVKLTYLEKKITYATTSSLRKS